MIEKLCLVLLVLTLPLTSALGVDSLPGRLNNPRISMAQFGAMKLFFYMSPEKDSQSRDFIKNLNEDLMIGILQDSVYFSSPELMLLSSLYRNPTGYDQDGKAIYVDTKGAELFLNYSQKAKSIAENFLNVKIHGTYRGSNLVLNFDGNRFHQDEVADLYNFIEKHPTPIPRYYIVQDLNLIDWQMADGAFSSLLSLDPNSEDRFVFPLFPKEVVGIFCAEPARYEGPLVAPKSQNALALPPHTIIAPIDWHGPYTTSSGKGKRISLVVRGLVIEDNIKDLEQRSHILPINRAQKKGTSSNTLTYEYPSGLMFKDLPDNNPLKINTDIIFSFEELGDIEIFQTKPEDNLPAIEILQHMLNLDCPPKDVIVKHVIKRGSGFSSIARIGHDIPTDSIVVALNSSLLPKGYQFYNLAQDFTPNGCPWVQLYHFPPSRCMFVPIDKVNELLLTPVEEIIFRDPKQDNDPDNALILRQKIVTQIDFFIFPKIHP